ncbi:MAG: hypothetical protein HY729_04000 [Candidatus Rokubacteria bacterium]|nr:hypothetical protein [Candidatus Rokubacteria bacterium]
MSARESIVYYCPRVNWLKLLGPVIAEQARRASGLAAVVVVPVAPLADYAGKNRTIAAGLFLDQVRAELPDEVELVRADSAAACLEALAVRRARAVVSVGLSLPPEIRTGVQAPSRARGVRWCSLGYIYEELLQVALEGVQVLDDWDVATTFTQTAVDRLAELLAEHGVAGGERVAAFRPIGFVECDQVAGFDRKALRAKYGLPEDRRVICFATSPPFPSLRAASPAMRWLFRQPWYRGRAMTGAAAALWRGRWPDVDAVAGYRDILAELRRFADRHGAILVGKTRGKHEDPGYVGRAMDRFLGDGAFHPFRTLELLHAADFYVGMYSSTAFEAAFVGRPMLTIVPFPPELVEHPFFFQLKRDFFFGAPGIWNTPGVSELAHTWSRRGFAAFAEWARRAPFPAGVDAAARSALVERTLGFDDFKASARFLDLVEGAIGREGRAR